MQPQTKTGQKTKLSTNGPAENLPSGPLAPTRPLSSASDQALQACWEWLSEAWCECEPNSCVCGRRALRAKVEAGMRERGLPVSERSHYKPTLEDFAASYDWQEAMKYARSECFEARPGGPQVVGFEMSDVAEVIVAVDGENDGPEWVAILRLKDGRFARLAAGCDYTGWGCQESGRAYVAPDLATLHRFGLTDEERERLGVSL